MPVLTKINTNSIAEDAITGDKFAGDTYLANTATQDISGTYAESRVYTSDAYTLSGNATVNGNLVLSSVKPNDDVVLTAGGAYTITGTGVLSGGSLYGRQTLTGMTGELGSAVTGSPAITGLGTVNSGTLGSGVTFPEGSIIQVLTGLNDSEAFTQSTGFVAIPDLTVTITPKSASSKFFIICNTMGYSDGGNAQVSYYTIYRDSTDLNTKNSSGFASIHLGSGAGHDLGSHICISDLDSPNTTSAITYGMYARVNNASYKTYWSMNSSRSDITVMEVAG